MDAAAHIEPLCTMTGPSPGSNDAGSSSSSNQATGGHATAEDFDDYEHADLSLDNALLADDPIDGNGKASYSLHITSSWDQD